MTRLETALDRIAFALDRKAQDEEQRRLTAAKGPDIEALAANLDALCARIRNVIGHEGE